VGTDTQLLDIGFLCLKNTFQYFWTKFFRVLLTVSKYVVLIVAQTGFISGCGMSGKSPVNLPRLLAYDNGHRLLAVRTAA